MRPEEWVWVEHGNRFGKWWTVEGEPKAEVELIDGVFYASAYRTYASVPKYRSFKTLRGAQRWVERFYGVTVVFRES